MDMVSLWLIDAFHLLIGLVHEWPGTTTLIFGLWLYWVLLYIS